MNYGLTEQELIDDLSAITNDESIVNIIKRNAARAASKQAPASVPQQQVDAYYYDGSLCYDELYLEKGQEVIVSENREVVFRGVISTITQNEVWIKKADGRVRYQMSQLKTGKVTLSLPEKAE